MVTDLRASARVLWSALPLWSPPSSADEPAAIRRQMEGLEKESNERVEKRLDKAEAQACEQRTEALQRDSSQAAASTTARSFNPDLSVTLQGSVNSYSANPVSYAMPDFQLGEEAGLAPTGTEASAIDICRA